MGHVQIISTVCDLCRSGGVTADAEPQRASAADGSVGYVDLCKQHTEEILAPAWDLVSRYGRAEDGTPLGSPRRRGTSDSADAPTRPQCGTCGATRSSDAILRNHLRAEHGIDPWADDPTARPCPHCPWRWHNLPAHVIRAHPDATLEVTG